MFVQDLCVCDVAACDPETSLAQAGQLMRKYGVGALPVVDRQDRVIGMITDRQIALEAARRNRPPAELRADDVMTVDPATCTERDTVIDVLRTMARNHCRRLPVVDRDERLQGIVSIDDIVCHAAERGDTDALPHREVVETLCAITQPYQAETGRRGRRGVQKR